MAVSSVRPAKAAALLLYMSATREGLDVCTTDWLVTLDVGREQNTWMDQRWCASGTRISLPLRVRFDQDGSTTCVAVGPYFDDVALSPGKVQLDGSWPHDVIRFSLECASGWVRGDNTLPEATVIYFAHSFLGEEPSKRAGALSVIQRRFLVRKERRLLGTFTMSRFTPETLLPASRVYIDKRWVK